MIEQRLDQVSLLDNIRKKLLWSLNQPERKDAIYISTECRIEAFAVWFCTRVRCDKVGNKLVQDN